MTRLVPHPILAVGLVLMWLLLTRFSLGNLILGGAIAFVAVRALTALQPSRVRLRRWDLIPRLVLIVMYDILRSNVAVARLILSGGRGSGRRSGFIEIPLELHHSVGLAILAVVLTSTPGTAWIQYDTGRGILLLHVFDLVEGEDWVDLVKNRYERLLMEIFE